MTHEICLALEQGAVLLAPTKRLVREFRNSYDRAQLEQGRKAWPTARILTYAAWLESLWSDSWEGENAVPELLAPFQEQALWEQVIHNSLDADFDLLDVRSTATAVADAWRLLHEWELPTFGPAYEFIEEAQAFLRWSRRFQQILQARGWTTEAQVAARVIECVQAKSCAVPPVLILGGFDELTPRQERLLAAVRSAGCGVESVAPIEHGAAPKLLACEDALAELRAAACWARSRIEAGVSRIGVVAPALSELRDQAEQIFEEILHPRMAVDALAPRQLLFHISEGRPLSAYGPIAAALSVLGLAQERLPSTDVSALLCSPFLQGSEAERGRRALLDARLRTRGYSIVPVQTLLSLASAQNKPYSCIVLARILETTFELRRARPSKQMPSRWGRYFRDILQIAGWPGERPLDSREYQAVERWKLLLAEMGRLDTVLGELTQSDALQLVRRQAADTPFQPENEGAPIQIMSEREASGVEFDALWIPGLHDGVWPPNVRPNPFLPLSLQREFELPGGSPERSLERATRVAKRLFDSAAEVICSYPRTEEDRELRPSPLVAHLPLGTFEHSRYRTVRDVLLAAAATLSWDADEAPSVLPHGTAARGGAALFEKQAACPFRAFAEFRLGARPLEQAQLGFNHRERGDLFHKTLEYFWERIQTHEELCSHSENELQSVIAGCVSRSLSESARDHGSQATPRLQEIERERLEILALTWLTLEKSRTPFTVIEREATRNIEVAGVVLALKIDRIDRLEDGSHVLLDYKTGDPNIKDWEGDRPDKPQLPLYSVTHNEPVAAVAFAVLKTGSMQFRGVSSREGALPKVKAASNGQTMEERLQQWRATIEALGTAYRESPPHVNPKYPILSCQFCQLEPLCRVQDRAAQDKAAGDE